MHSDFRKFLQDEFLRRSERNKQYSLRAFAKVLGIGSSDLSKLINLKRRATPKLIQRCAVPLGLSKAQIAYFTKHADDPSGEADETIQFRNLSADTFRVIADWYHFGLLELMKLPDFSQDPQWLSRRLGISPVAVNIAVERLIRVGFLRVDEQGAWRDCVGPTSMLSSFKSSQARKHLQSQILNLAQESLENVPITEREQSAVIMAIDSSRMAEAKALIDKFRTDMIRVLAGPQVAKDRLAILNLSLFPIYPQSIDTAASDDTLTNFANSQEINEELH